MQTSDVTGIATQTVAETLANLGADPRAGLTNVDVQERLKKYGAKALVEKEKSSLPSCSVISGGRPWMIVQDVVKLGPYGIIDPDRSWKRSLFQSLRVSSPSRPAAAR